MRLTTPRWADKHFIRFEQTQTKVPELVHAASGMVLELGPGLGNQLCRFDKTAVTRIVGIENNESMAPDVDRQIKEHGLDAIYELIISGVEDSTALERHGIVADSVDTVVSIQVLCSVPDPAAIAKELYQLLKPGGKFIFWEHHCSSDWLTAAVQSKLALKPPSSTKIQAWSVLIILRYLEFNMETFNWGLQSESQNERNYCRGRAMGEL